MFLGEAAAPTTLTRPRARAPRGERAVGRVPRRRWAARSPLAALPPAGVGAAVLAEGATGRAALDAYVEQLLVPSLRPGQVVVLDNLSVHKSARARALVEGAGCRLLPLPRYSPDLNPIELAFAKAKQALRRAEARDSEALVAAAGPALDGVTAAAARGFYAHCGFALPGPLR